MQVFPIISFKIKCQALREAVDWSPVLCYPAIFVLNKAHSSKNRISLSSSSLIASLLAIFCVYLTLSGSFTICLDHKKTKGVHPLQVQVNPGRCERVLTLLQCNSNNLSFNLTCQLWLMCCCLSAEEIQRYKPDQHQPTVCSQQMKSSKYLHVTEVNDSIK